MHTTQKQRDAVLNLFSFVEEVSGVRRAVTKNISSLDWKLGLAEIDATLPGIQALHPNTKDPSLILSIVKLDVPSCPKLPEELLDVVIGNWLSPDWKVAWREPFASLTLQTDVDIREGDSEETIAEKRALQALRPFVPVRIKWLEERTKWLEERKVVVKSNELFDRFMTLRSKVAESNLRSEAVFGNFMFTSDPRLTTNKNEARYPLVVRPLELILSSTEMNLPILEVRLSGATRFQPEVLQSFAEENVDLTAFKSVEELIKDEDPLPYGDETLVNAFRRQTVNFSIDCRWHEMEQSFKEVDSGVKFWIQEEPILMLQLRPTGLKEAIASIRKRIEEVGDIPEHLLEVVCPDVEPTICEETNREQTFENALAETAGEDNEILLTKPANTDQLSIARAIMRNNVVLVQGPPGTGKTHTIANLLGHFLAQGKRVLVTSHTQKALAVLKDKLPSEIQPLSVSMMDGKKDLEKTIHDLCERFSSLSVEKLAVEVKNLSEERKSIIEQQKIVRTRIFNLRHKETQGPIYKGRQYSLTELAQYLRNHESEFAPLIPGDVKDGPMPLSVEELDALYKTNGVWSADTQNELMFELPPVEQLPTPEKMANMHAEYQRLLKLKNSETDAIESVRSHTNSKGDDFVDYELTGGYSISVRASKNGNPALESVFRNVPDTKILELAQSDPFVRGMLLECLEDDSYAPHYQKLAESLEAADEAYRLCDHLRLESDLVVEFSRDNFDDIQAGVDWFLNNEPDGKPNLWTKCFNSECKAACRAIEGVRVNGSAPACKEAFEAIRDEVAFKVKEAKAASLWAKFAARLDLPNWETFGPKAVRDLAEKYVQIIPSVIRWEGEVFEPCLKTLEASGFNVRGLPEQTGVGAARAAAKLAYIEALFLKILVPLSEYRTTECALEEIEQWRVDVVNSLSRFAQLTKTAKALQETALFDPASWKVAYERLVALTGAKHAFEERTRRIAAIRDYAPDWADAIEEGRAGFTGSKIPDNIEAAWDWKQFERIYQERMSESIEELQAKSTNLSSKLRKNTAQLAASKAWLECKKRVHGKMLSNLSTLANYMKRAQGNGKRALSFRQEVNRLLPQCQDAVPIWIMMISDALLNFNSNAQFDIVIIDEASQADITSLPILYMGKKIIVVGDDKQVTPSAVGTNDYVVEEINRRLLEGVVKEPKLYDAKASLYGIIQSMAFPVRMLREHFRCVPDIIGYCNELSYDGKIRPLRDSSTTNLRPALVPYRVDGESENGLNKAECQAVINLLKAMTHDPAYEGKTLGVICMRSGNPTQINRLRSMILSSFDPREIEERQLICGSSAELQGDERDVIILSLVDSSEEGNILRKTGEGVDESVKKRYNVAVSRAKDQLWVVHSFDADSQLKHDDIRRGLFAWIKRCNSGEVDEEQIRREADSEFEVQVAKALRERGYNLEQQHAVGPYRIDIVVRSKGNAVALECDGERYHGGDLLKGEEQVRYDMERQTVLERNGWRFVRLRGAEFFRNPKETIDRLCLSLHERGIDPEESETAEIDDSATQRVIAAAMRYVEGVNTEPRLTSYKAKIDRTVEVVTPASIETVANEDKKTVDALTARVSAPQSTKERKVPPPSTRHIAEIPSSKSHKKRSEKEKASPTLPRKTKPVRSSPSNSTGDKADLEKLLKLIQTRSTDNLANGMPIIVLASQKTSVCEFQVLCGGKLYADVGSSKTGISIKVLSVQGVRARGLPPSENKSGSKWRIWKIARGELDDRAEIIANFILRTIQADRS